MKRTVPRKHNFIQQNVAVMKSPTGSQARPMTFINLNFYK